MKRILTLAIAAMLVVAFAIPTFAAPKVELVGGGVKLNATYGPGDFGTITGPVFGSLTFKFSADNFVFTATTAYNTPAIPGTETWNVPGLDIVNYNFALELPYMTLSGMYDEMTVAFGYHGGHELRLASNDKFKETLGFTWAVYNNDDNTVGAFDSLHAQLGIPVGEQFNSTLEYVNEGGNQLGKVDLSYSVSDDLSFEAIAAKNITSATDDFFFATVVNFPIVEGWAGGFYAQYGMANFAADVDYANGYGVMSGYVGDSSEALLDVTYNNESANFEVLTAFYGDSAFGNGTIYGFAEYVSNGGNSFWSSGNRRANYADTNDSFGRGWNSQYKWVRDNKANEFAFRANGSYTLATGAYGVQLWGMFAPDAVPAVITLKGNYSSTGAWYVRNWLGIRLNSDIHFAVYDRYVWTPAVVDDPATPVDETAAAYGDFDVDAALVYAKDSVTASLTATNLVSGWGLNLFTGISF